jgi:hypothetical protein
MLRITFCQLSMGAVDPDSIELEATSFERHLPELLPRLVPVEELRAMFPSQEGAPSSCPLQLMAMLLLQFRYDLSERQLYQRCIRDLGFRYALGLQPGSKPPTPRTLRRFRQRMVATKGEDFLLHLSLRLAREEHLINDVALQALDSTNTDCRGAIVDTYNLVAAGIRQVVRQVARCLGVRPHEMAQCWDVGRYMARSIKGAAAIDWSDEGQRNALLTEEIADADRVARKVDELAQTLTLPEEVVEAARLLAHVARQDVEQLDDGTFRIARGTANGRVISVTDPEARHGHKSQSKLINGFKTHAMATVESQFVTGIAITDAATHDAQPTAKLIKQAEANDVKPDEAVGDAAYGTGANLRACNDLGVQMRTKIAQPSSRGAIPKQDFDINLEAMTVTCPEGQTTEHYTLVQVGDGNSARVPQFRFDRQVCQLCERKSTCCSQTAKGGKRVIKLNEFERELQDNRAFSQTDRGKDVLRSRSAIERLLSHLVKMGMRHARFFSIKRVQFQAYMVAAVYNVQRLITLRVQAAGT